MSLMPAPRRIRYQGASPDKGTDTEEPDYGSSPRPLPSLSRRLSRAAARVGGEVVPGKGLILRASDTRVARAPHGATATSLRVSQTSCHR